MRGLLALLVLAPAAAAQAPFDAMTHAIDFRFAPPVVNMTEGGTFVVMNLGASAHTFTARDGTFDADLPAPPQGNWTEASLVPPVGEHPFYCRYHPNMTGLLRVTAADAPTRDAPGAPAALAVAALGVAAAAWRARR